MDIESARVDASIFAQVSELAAYVDTKADAESVDSNFTALVDTLGEQAVVLATLDEVASDLQNQVTDAAAAVAEVTASTDLQLAALTDSLDMKANLDFVATGFDNLNSFISALADNQGMVAATVSYLNTSLDGLDSSVSALGSSVTTLSGSLSSTQDDLASVVASTNTLIDNLASLTTAVVDLQNAMATTTTSVSALQTELTETRAALCAAATFAHSKDADYPVPSFCN